MCCLAAGTDDEDLSTNKQGIMSMWNEPCTEYSPARGWWAYEEVDAIIEVYWVERTWMLDNSFVEAIEVNTDYLSVVFLRDISVLREERQILSD